MCLFFGNALEQQNTILLEIFIQATRSGHIFMSMRPLISGTITGLWRLVRQARQPDETRIKAELISLFVSNLSAEDNHVLTGLEPAQSFTFDTVHFPYRVLHKGNSNKHIDIIQSGVI